MSERELFTADAVITDINMRRDYQNKKGYASNYVFVEFTDKEGNQQDGAFVYPLRPIDSMLRVGSHIQIEYREHLHLPGCYVRLKDPELYERLPSPEEKAMYKSQTKSIAVMGAQSLLLIVVICVLYSLMPLLLVPALLLGGYYVYRMMIKQSIREKDDVFLSWRSDPEDHAIFRGKPVPCGRRKYSDTNN